MKNSETLILLYRNVIRRNIIVFCRWCHPDSWLTDLIKKRISPSEYQQFCQGDLISAYKTFLELLPRIYLEKIHLQPQSKIVYQSGHPKIDQLIDLDGPQTVDHLDLEDLGNLEGTELLWEFLAENESYKSIILKTYLQDLLFFKKYQVEVGRSLESLESLTIAFHSNQLIERGTEVALYDYAYYAQKLLGHKAIILIPEEGDRKPNVVDKFERQFPLLFYGKGQLDNLLQKHQCDLLYMITCGANNHLPVSSIPIAVHAVFDCSQPHGDAYASISETVTGWSPSVAVVPHMIDLPSHQDNLRQELSIPEDALVIGRYGGKDTFNIRFVKETVVALVHKYGQKLFFLFANTDKFGSPCNNLIFLDQPLIDGYSKVKFINTCDAMIHARANGETFGLSVGEFSTLNKPIITTPATLCNHNNHLRILRDRALLCHNSQELEAQILYCLEHKNQLSRRDWNAYRDYTPQKVMEQFDRIFVRQEFVSPIRVTYGPNQVEVTSRAVPAWYRHPHRLVIPKNTFFNGLFGDPAPNVHKELQIIYQDRTFKINEVDVGQFHYTLNLETGRMKKSCFEEGDILLSVLIPSLPERADAVSQLLATLEDQIKRDQLPVELLTLIDNRKSTIGRKRNQLMKMAQGVFLVQVDDDDQVSDHYLSTLVKCIRENPEVDCITYQVEVKNPNGSKVCRYSKNFPHLETENFYLRRPNCRMCFRSSLARSVPFKNISWGEDDHWAFEISSKIEQEICLPDVLYTYYYTVKSPEHYTRV